MLRKLSLDVTSMRILPDYGTRDVVFSNIITRPVTLKCSVFNKGFLVNQ